MIVLADSRQGLRDFPPMGFKMNAAELARMAGTPVAGIDAVRQHAADLACAESAARVRHAGRAGHRRCRFERQAPSTCRPTRSADPIDIVGAGDAVTANLAAALAAGAHQREAMELAMAAASIVVHQLGTTGTASIAQLADLNTTTSELAKGLIPDAQFL